MSQHKCVSFTIFGFLQRSERIAARELQAPALRRSLTAQPFQLDAVLSPKGSIMDTRTASNAAHTHRPGRGRVFESIVDAIGDTPIVRLGKLPQQHGVNATIL